MKAISTGRNFALTVIFTVVLAALILFGLTGCISQANDNEDNPIITSSEYPFETIHGYNYLVYDKNTKMIYYLFSTRERNGDIAYGYGYMSPYYENGHLCIFENGQIVEIIE